MQIASARALMRNSLTRAWLARSRFSSSSNVVGATGITPLIMTASLVVGWVGP
jgi:hypothetical protein